MTIRDVLMGCVMTGNGRQVFTGLFNENGFPVKVILRKDDEEVILSIVYDDDDEKEKDTQPRDCGISEEEIDRVCKEQEDCDNCPLCEYCDEVFGEEDDEDEDADSDEDDPDVDEFEKFARNFRKPEAPPKTVRIKTGE